MLNVFPSKIHGTIPVANPGLIYGAMLFRTFFLEVILGIIWDVFLDANWDVFLGTNWDINLDSNWDDNCDANWDANWDINWDSNQCPK